MEKITKLITLALLLVFASGLKAQDEEHKLYQSFFGNDSTELNLRCIGDDWAIQYLCKIYSKDTIRINDNLYYFSKPQYLKTEAPYWIYYYHYDDTIYFREDLQNGRLYFYVNDSDINEDNQELLICDMSLNVGDMFRFPLSFHEDILGREEEVVVDTIRIENGKKVMDFVYHFSEPPYDDLVVYTLTEGVFPPLIPNIYEGEYNRLICQHNDGELIYKYKYSDKCFWEMGSDIEENVEKMISVHPTIFSNTETISISSDSEIKDVKMMDMLGRRIDITFNKNDESSYQIRLNERCSSGIYFYTVRCEDDIVTGKLIKK